MQNELKESERIFKGQKWSTKGFQSNATRNDKSENFLRIFKHSAPSLKTEKKKRKSFSFFLFMQLASILFFFCSNRLLLQNGGFAPNLWTEVNSKRAHFFPLDAQNFCALYKKMGDVKCPLFVSTFWKRSKNTLGSFAVVVLWSFEAISINIRHEQSMTTTPRGAWNGRYFGTAFLN